MTQKSRNPNPSWTVEQLQAHIDGLFHDSLVIDFRIGEALCLARDLLGDDFLKWVERYETEDSRIDDVMALAERYRALCPDGSIDEWLSNKQKNCPDCGAGIGEPHQEDCDVQRCSVCGRQKILCDCPNHEPHKSRWTGLWPEADVATGWCGENEDAICLWSDCKDIQITLLDEENEENKLS